MLRRTRLCLAAALSLPLVAAGACSAGSTKSGEDGSTFGGAAGAAQAGGSGSGGAAGASVAGAAGSGGFVAVPDAGPSDALPDGCSTIDAKATRIPLHLYLLIDRSSSMSGRWDAVKAGVSAFLGDKASADIDVAMTPFPAVNQTPGNECNFVPYQDPTVPFGLLPGNQAAIDGALAGTQANGFGSPVYPALLGAYARGGDTLKQKPGDSFVVLLVTDGSPAPQPATCTGVDALSPDVIATLAEKALTLSKVRTFVVSFSKDSDDVAFASKVSQKGGGTAVFVDNIDVEKKFRDALAAVRGEGLGCEFPIPPPPAGMKLDFGQVNVRYTAGDGKVTDVGRSPGCLAPSAWDYDDPTAPTKIRLCGELCKAVKADGLAQIEAVLGCPTVIVIK